MDESQATTVREGFTNIIALFTTNLGKQKNFVLFTFL